MKYALFPLLFVISFSCQKSTPKTSSLVLSTTKLDVIMDSINHMPIDEIEYQLEMTKEGIILDTVGTKTSKFYEKDDAINRMISEYRKKSNHASRIKEAYYYKEGKIMTHRKYGVKQGVMTLKAETTYTYKEGHLETTVTHTVKDNDYTYYDFQRMTLR